MRPGKTFITAATRGRGRSRGRRIARRNVSGRLRRPGMTGIHKAGHGLAGRNEDFYEAAATPGCIDVTNEKAKSILLRCLMMVVTGQSAEEATDENRGDGIGRRRRLFRRAPGQGWRRCRLYC